ncbi:MAG: hypothetical protein WAR22_05280 [Desulfomonilia bacterium]|jgi:hypothetical protein
MAGILVTLGAGPVEAHDKMRGHMVRSAGLVAAQDHSWEHARLTRFSRLSLGKIERLEAGPGGEGTADPGTFESGFLSLWVVGTLIYRGLAGRQAVECLGRELEEARLEDLARHCDGPFFLALAYSREPAITFMTDHAGIVNVYACRFEGGLALCTSSMALSAVLPVTINPEGVAQFLRTANVYGSGTIYREISLLEPGSIYRARIVPEPGEPEQKTYWKSPVEIDEGMSFARARDLLGRRLLEGVEPFAREDLVCDFTAGFDSRLLVAAFSCLRPISNLPTFVFGPGTSKEVMLVREYCRTLGMSNLHLELPDDWGEMLPRYVDRALEVCDGEENAVVYAPILLAQEHKASSHRYSVGGLGGELYRDFWWIQELYGSRRPANLDRLISLRILQYEFDPSIFSDEWRPVIAGVKDSLQWAFEETLSDMDRRGTYNTLQIDSLYLRQKIRRWAGRTLSSSSRIVGTIAPLTLKGCLEAAMVVPPAFKRNGRLVKALVEDLCEPLADLRMLNGAPCRNITLGNAYRFYPLLVDYAKRAARKAAQKTLKRTILLDGSLSYRPSWVFSCLFSHPEFREGFAYDSLLTRSLYDPEGYTRFYERSASEDFAFHGQLGAIITLEMRARRDAQQAGKGGAW